MSSVDEQRQISQVALTADVSTVSDREIAEAHCFQSIRTDRIRDNLHLSPLRSVRDERSNARLAASVAKPGLLQPIGVVQSPNDPRWYDLVFGGRRLEAARRNGEEEIFARVMPQDTDIEVARLVEQLVRQDLHPIDEATALANLKAKRGLKNVTLAALIGVSVAHLTLMLSIARLTPEERTAILGFAQPPSRDLLIEFTRVKDPAVRQRMLKEMGRGDLTRDAARERRKEGRAIHRNAPDRLICKSKEHLQAALDALRAEPASSEAILGELAKLQVIAETIITILRASTGPSIVGAPTIDPGPKSGT